MNWVYISVCTLIANIVLLVIAMRQLSRMRASIRDMEADAERLEAEIEQISALRTALWHLLLGCWHMRQWPLIHILADQVVQAAINDVHGGAEGTAER